MNKRAAPDAEGGGSGSGDGREGEDVGSTNHEPQLKQQASERARSDAPSARDASATVLPVVGIPLFFEKCRKFNLYETTFGKRRGSVGVSNLTPLPRREPAPPATSLF